MGIFDFILGLFGWRPAASPTERHLPAPDRAAEPARKRVVIRGRRCTRRVRLAPLRKPRPAKPISNLADISVPELPYRFARVSVYGGYMDLSRDSDDLRLTQLGLPVFHTPEELANWLEIPVGRLAWLIHRCEFIPAPPNSRAAHYHFRWLKKRQGGYRLIEAPKSLLKKMQEKILREILDRVPVHHACHGFVVGRSIRTNAEPHAGQRVVVKLDLANFYTTVSHSRIVAIFRSLGYCREAAIWLAGLTTSAVPPDLELPENQLALLAAYRGRHLPQGAPTSPALANLSAFSLDLRLSGLARKFQANYTRYADDLTFSGSGRFLGSLSTFLQLVGQIIKSERFQLHPRKRRVLRSNQQQKVTGVVVNQHVNIARLEFDRLKAVLHNCLRLGPSTQNREAREDFPQHLLGRIGHVKHLNPDKGERLLAMYRQIDWKR